MLHVSIHILFFWWMISGSMALLIVTIEGCAVFEAPAVLAAASAPCVTPLTVSPYITCPVSHDSPVKHGWNTTRDNGCTSPTRGVEILEISESRGLETFFTNGRPKKASQKRLRFPGGWGDFWSCFRLDSTKKSSLPTESDKEAWLSALGIFFWCEKWWANEQKMTIFPT